MKKRSVKDRARRNVIRLKKRGEKLRKSGKGGAGMAAAVMMLGVLGMGAVVSTQRSKKVPIPKKPDSVPKNIQQGLSPNQPATLKVKIADAVKWIYKWSEEAGHTKKCVGPQRETWRWIETLLASRAYSEYEIHASRRNYSLMHDIDSGKTMVGMVLIGGGKNDFREGPWKFGTVCKKRYIFAPLYLLIQKNNHIIKSHMNYMIIDSGKKTCERYEPHGTGTDDMHTQIVDDFVEKGLVGTGFRYMSPVNTECPKFGAQYYAQVLIENCPEASGYCATWAVLYAHIRMLVPTSTTSDIAHVLSKMGPKYLGNLVSFYTSKIEQSHPKIFENVAEK